MKLQSAQRAVDPEPNPLARQEDQVVAKIIEAIRTLRYGSVEIVVQDSRVVQIERREKTRFERPTRP